MGGGGGVVGRGIVEELSSRYSIRSYHRTPTPSEKGKVEFVPGDLHDVERFPRLLEGVDAVVNVVWYREPGPDRLFVRTVRSLGALVEAARRANVSRWVQVSLPPAPPDLEERTPYLKRRREFETALVQSGIPTNLLQPSAVFAAGDRLIGVMLDLLRRHRHFPMFGDGGYHLSPVSNRDVGALVGEALEGRLPPVQLVGGPERMTYAELLELLQVHLGVKRRLVRVSPGLGRFTIQLFNAVGWHPLYTYEYDWLLSDLLGLPPAPRPGRDLIRLGDFLRGLPRSSG
jgi:uncharacterized protein YbjT (DUF2867 family)